MMSSVSKLVKETGKGENEWQEERWVHGLGVTSQQGIFMLQVLLCVEFHVLPLLVIL